MDASEHELDARLYKASAELLSELRTKLPLLIRAPNGNPRRWVLATKLDRFQEWPQLLDPYLSQLIDLLAGSFLNYCMTSPSQYNVHHDHSAELYPLARAVSVVLYAFCKVRGTKVIIRLLNNEPRYVEPLLVAFRLWTIRGATANGANSGLRWEERYVMLMWLSHLMLAPFALATISGLATISEASSYQELGIGLPDIACNLLYLALDHLENASRDREAACVLATRLALRSDMQVLDLPGRLIACIAQKIQSTESDRRANDYRNIGLLSLLYGLTHSASDSEVAPFLERTFNLAFNLARTDDERLSGIRDSAPVRKLLIKIARSALVHALVLESRGISQWVGNTNTMTEEAVQMLLDLLADNDTPVRQAASKALSLIALRLSPDMSSQVTEAVLDGIQDGVLLQDVSSGKLFPLTSAPADSADRFVKNVDAVDPLLWHGSMLTLGHLLFRRALPISQLPSVIEALLIGLEFEQRSSVGTSVGVAVRDAACFGTWSLARKYSSAELLSIPTTSVMIAGTNSLESETLPNVIQVMATNLVSAACLDTSGNLRRGSSAALQELIGRHPDMVLHGIPVVQVVDYHAVARRSRALIEVVEAAAKLDMVYYQALLQALLRWRGARATDRASRSQTALAIKRLLALPESPLQKFQANLLIEIRRLKPSNIGGNAAARHGLLLALAAFLEVLCGRPRNEARVAFTQCKDMLFQIDSLTGVIDGRVTPDVDNVLEAICCVISAAASLSYTLDCPGTANISYGWTDQVLPVLERCTVATDNEAVIVSAATAYLKTFEIIDTDTQDAILRKWLEPRGQNIADFTSRGRIAALSELFTLLSKNKEHAATANSIVAYLCSFVTGNFRIETKTSAMKGIAKVIGSWKSLSDMQQNQIHVAINVGLSDYTVDQRGDIGSLLRSESLQTVQILQQVVPRPKNMQSTQQLLVKLATEKLGRVRHEAWTCLVKSDAKLIDSQYMSLFQHQADVSSPSYFRAILQLLTIPEYHEYVLLGLINSSAAGTDDINKSSSAALITMLLDRSSEQRQVLISSIFDFVVKHFQDLSCGEDREVVPILDFLTFLIEQIPLLIEEGTGALDVEKLWQICQKVHSTSLSMSRSEALTRLYSVLGMYQDLRPSVLDRLSRMLLHRWPKIRLSAAESIFNIAEPLSLTGHDWTLPVSKIKPEVLKLRRELGVAGTVTTST